MRILPILSFIVAQPLQCLDLITVGVVLYCIVFLIEFETSCFLFLYSGDGRIIGLPWL